MADLITRLKVDSTEYDAKIKRAAQGLQHLADSAHNAGGILNVLEDENRQYVKSLGQMETVAKTARGRLSELTAAFTDMRSVYNSLTQEEKDGEFGRELNKQLEIMKGRINDAKKELKDIDQELGNTKQAGDSAKSGIEGLTQALGINIKSLVGWGAALSAAKMALGVAKDAILASETNVDDWGRTVRSAEGVYQSFLQSLNTGDFSGFLNNIGQVTQAAREAYNALDELGTRMTIINPERARLQARQQELRAEIRRNGADSEAGKAALAELKKIEPMLSKSFGTESKLNYNAFEKLVRERLAQGGINLNQKSFAQFMKTFSSDAAFKALQRNARGSSELKATSEVGKFRTVDTRNTEQKLLDLFTDEWRQANSGFLTAAFNAKGAAASNALGNARYMKTGGGGGGGRSGGSGSTITYEAGSLAAQQAEVQRLTKLWQESGVAVRDQYLQPLVEAEKKLQQMKDVMGMQKDLAMGKFSGQGAEAFRESMRNATGLSTGLGVKGSMLLDEKALAKAFAEAQKQPKARKEEGEVKSVSGEVSKITGDVQGIFTGLQQLGIEIPDGIQSVLSSIQAVTAILTGISSIVTIIAAIQGTKAVPVIGWALAGGGIVKAAGGTIVGNSYSGDNMRGLGPGGQLYGLNAGEVVLNKSQVSNLASSLTGNGMQGMKLDAVITGEQIRLVLNNNGRRTGRGEYVQTKSGRV